MRLLRRLLTGCLITPLAWAQVGAKTQNHEALRALATQFLTSQLGMTADARIRIQPLDPQLRLPACAAPEVFLPAPPAVLRGSLRLGIRCQSPQAWLIYVNASVVEARTYYLTQGALEAGHVLRAEDLTSRRAYPEELPAGAVFDPQQLVGRTLLQPLEAGAVLRAPLMRAELVITAGQTVKLLTNGPGFSISSEGRAMGNATSGQRIQVRSASGQLVQGVAMPGGVVSVSP